MTTTTTVVGKVKAPDGTVVEGAEILARLNGFDYDEEFGYITSRRISTTTDANGEFSFELWPNTRGTEGTIYRIVINSPINGVSTNFTATIPEQDEVELNDAADFSPVPPLSDAEQLVNDAKAFKDKAEAFANEAEDVEVEPGLFSALHYSEKAEDSAIAAAASESNAAASESNAASSASAASTSASNAATSESNAASSASAAATSESNAQTAETSAISAKDDAVAAKNATENIFDTFDDRFLGAFSSAPTTDNDGNPIVAGAVYYDTTQQEVYFYNGATWDAPAAQAETSATNALASENAAETSANEAATSASNASDSETAAANSASAAATSAQNAADSFDSFDDRYLGPKSSEPATDNDGDPLQTGALYFDTTLDELRVYDGSQWLSTNYNSANVNITGGTISGTDVDVSGATFTVANDQISGDAINGGTATPTTLNSTNLNVDSGTLFVDSANNRVGVGTSSPSEALDVNGTANANNITRGGSQVYSRNNIVGTVSESSGVPTGEIIERGSNSNGEFVKYADGTMICTMFRASATGTAVGGTFNSNYPSNFAFNPLAASVHCEQNNFGQDTDDFSIFSILGLSTVDIGVRIGNPSTGTRGDSKEIRNVRFIVIGRWY